MSIEADNALTGDLTWEALADRRPHRLKRGKHFTVEPRQLQTVARQAADELGVAVHTARDELRRYQYVWLQFADGNGDPNEPCPRCRGRRLVRRGAHFGSCPACGMTLLMVTRRGAARSVVGPEVEADDGVATGVGEIASPPVYVPEIDVSTHVKWAGRLRVSGFEDVDLTIDDGHPDPRYEVWYGYGRRPGGVIGLIEVVYPLHAGERIPDPSRTGEDLHRVHFWRLEPLQRALAIGALDGWEAAEDMLRRRVQSGGT